ncbi:MAG: MarR family transcriptional regulator [Ilumatobacteraceae bacterium]
MTIDPVQALEDGWRAELPDLDTSAMITVARLNRISGLLRRRIEERLAQEGSSPAEFDVLSALRRQGPPYRLKPSELARATMLSPSGMTHRVGQLHADGLIDRVVDPESRRTAPVELTDEGAALAERLVRVVAELETQVMSVLSPRQRERLDAIAAELAGAL